MDPSSFGGVMAKKKLFLIDGMALAFRSFFAFQRPLYRADGLPTAAIYGTAVFLNKLMTEERPDFIACALDTAEPTFRHAMYPEYKGTRSAMPDDLSKQMPYIFDLFVKMGCPVIKQPGFEADDIIGTLARRFASPDLDVFIVSGDKDFMQLVSEHTFVYVPKKNEDAHVYDAAAVREKFGCSPERVIDVLALMGDSVDNVPGVPGIGEKTAAQLIASYGSLEGIYERVEAITAKKQKENLLAYKADAFLSRKLVTIDTQMPLSADLGDFSIDIEAALAQPELLDFYQSMEFKNLLARQGVVLGSSAKAVLKQAKTDHKYLELSELDNDIIQKWSSAGVVAFTLPWEGADTVVDKPDRIALAVGEDVFVLPLRSDQKALWAMLFAAPCLKICHSLKQISQVLRNFGIEVGAPFFCIKLADYLIDPNRDNHSMDVCVPRYVGLVRKPLSAADQKIADPLANQLARDAELCLAMYPLLLAKLEELALVPVLRDVELPLAIVLGKVEQRGLRVDAEQLDMLSETLRIRLDEIKVEMEKEVGYSFNLSSPKQLQKVLFEDLCLHEKLGIKRLKKTKTGFSTDESVLTQLVAHKVPRLILEHRSLSVLKNTFVDALPSFIHPQTGKIHTKLHQTVAATGRLSSDSPNLQNIPMRSEVGRQVRKAFLPTDVDDVLITADYSQVEIRLLAHLSKEAPLLEGFSHHLDIHRLTAAKIFNLPLEAVSKEMRNQAKAINFGIIYGMGPQRLAAETGVSMSEAKTFIEKYFLAYPHIRLYTQNLIQTARLTGFTTTMTGRRRPLPGIHDGNRAVVARAENIAINAPIQGSAADLIKLAMIRVEAKLEAARLRCQMLLQIHDELVFTCHRDDVAEAIPLVKEAMEHAFEISVPLDVLVNTGANWLEAH